MSLAAEFVGMIILTAAILSAVAFGLTAKGN